MADRPTYEQLEEWLAALEKQTCDYGEVKQELVKLSHAVEQSPSAIMITDNDGLIEYVNPKFTEISGYSSEQALGMNAADPHPPAEGGEVDGLSDQDLLDIFADVPSTSLPGSALEAGIGMIDLLVETGLCKSKGEARRLIQGGGANINNRKAVDIERVVTPDDLASETCLLLRQGKKTYHLVRFE